MLRPTGGACPLSPLLSRVAAPARCSASREAPPERASPFALPPRVDASSRCAPRPRHRASRAAALPERTAAFEALPPLSPSSSRLLLLTVPLAWGTYNPALRVLYSLPHPPSPGELSATRLLLATLPYVPTLFALAAAHSEQRRRAGGLAAEGGAEAVVAASLELGGYNILGTAGQAWGLAHTSVGHAAILLSSINVLVPVGAALTGEPVRPATWGACLLCLAGIAVLNADGRGGDGGDSGGPISVGDCSVLFSAFCYAAYTVRLGALSRLLPSLPLAAGKTGVLALGCIGWALAEAGMGFGAHPLGDGSVLWGGGEEPGEVMALGWTVVLVSALLPGSYATWAQARAQCGLTSTEAQVILAATPVISTLIAAFVLGEPLGPNVLIAGGLVVSASLLSALGAGPPDAANTKV